MKQRHKQNKTKNTVIVLNTLPVKVKVRMICFYEDRKELHVEELINIFRKT